MGVELSGARGQGIIWISFDVQAVKALKYVPGEGRERLQPGLAPLFELVHPFVTLTQVTVDHILQASSAELSVRRHRAGAPRV